MKKPHYIISHRGRDAISGQDLGWRIVDVNGNGRIHGVEVVAHCATKAEAMAWVERATADAGRAALEQGQS